MSGFCFWNTLFFWSQLLHIFCSFLLSLCTSVHCKADHGYQGTHTSVWDPGFWSFLTQDKVDENLSHNQNLKSLLIFHLTIDLLRQFQCKKGFCKKKKGGGRRKKRREDSIITSFLKKESLESFSGSSSNNPNSASIVVMNPYVPTMSVFSDMLSWELALLKCTHCDGTFLLLPSHQVHPYVKANSMVVGKH